LDAPSIVVKAHELEPHPLLYY